MSDSSIQHTDSLYQEYKQNAPSKNAYTKANYEKKCWSCKKSSSELTTETDKKIQSCSACKVATYCSRDCQKKDWSQHKPNCTKLKNEAESLKEKQKQNAQEGDDIVEEYFRSLENNEPFDPVKTLEKLLQLTQLGSEDKKASDGLATLREMNKKL